MSNTVSRVLYQTAIYLALLSPAGSSSLPGTQRATVLFLSGLAPDGVYTAFPVTREAVSSYLAFSPLPVRKQAVIFCCTILGVTSTGRYPASCPVEPGLSSPVPEIQARLSVLLITIQRYFNMMSGKCKDLIETWHIIYIYPVALYRHLC